ncbi:MAG: HAMP domain-containing sensor histidine kinase [Acidobacteriota bacterium]
MRQRASFGRTKLALFLTLGAVAVPSISWLLIGSQQLEREAKLRQTSVEASAYKKSIGYAAKLTQRLDQLLQAETRRPFYHYQSLFHDPKAAAEGVAVLVSPLANGANDPFVQVHFQVNEQGQLQLPSINDEIPDVTSEMISTHCALFDDLSEVTAFCNTLDTEPPWRRNGYEGNGDSERWSVTKLTEAGWYQHLEANKVYAEWIYQGTRPAMPASARAAKKVAIHVGPFTWYTLLVDDHKALVAVRGVKTPVGMWHQGFVVDAEATAAYLAEAPYPASFRSEAAYTGDQNGVKNATSVVGDTGWWVSLDIGDALADMGSEAAHDRGRFLSAVAFSTLFALIAGALVVGLVYQSERLAQQRAQFAASAAHELRTPIAGLRLYGEMLAEGMGDPSRSRAYARRLAGEAERLGRVVTNVLSFTRLERQTLSVEPRLDDLSAAVHDAVERQRPAIEEAGATLEADLPEAPPEVMIDRDAINHIVQNLLDNAEKYTRETDDRKIRVQVVVGEKDLQLSIADNGEGVPPAIRGRLFKPFARGDHGDAVSGLGLGLVLVRALAEAQGGGIRHDDGPDGGAVFTVTFPRTS